MVVLYRKSQGAVGSRVGAVNNLSNVSVPTIRPGLSMALLASLFWLATPAAACPIAIDVGHYRDRPGAISARGVAEFDFNLALANAIRQALEQRGCAVILIGADGNAADLRARTIQAQRASFFLSVHHDSVQEQFLKPWMDGAMRRRYTDQYAGFALFVSHANFALEKSLRCASALGTGLRGGGFTPSLYHADAMPGEQRPFADVVNGVHYFDGLVVLKTAQQAAVLFEAGVILNPVEEGVLSLAATREKIAGVVATALLGCVDEVQRSP